MGKDPFKWKGRGNMDEDTAAERNWAKKQAIELKFMKEQARALKKFQAQKRKELKNRYAADKMKTRMQQLGVFRALVSGVGSMQLKITFKKWLEYMELVRSAKEEVYRRRRWQLSCPEAHVAGIAGLDDLEPQQVNLHYMKATKGSRKYIVEGDENCSASLAVRETGELPPLIPRYRSLGYAQQTGMLSMNRNIMRGGIGGRGHNPVAELYGDDPNTGNHASNEKAPQLSTDSWDSSTTLTDGSTLNTWSTAETDSYIDPVARKKHGSGEKQHKLGCYLFDERGDSLARLRGGLPAHETYGHAPDLMTYKNCGIHWRTGRLVKLDEQYRLFTYAYPSPRGDVLANRETCQLMNNETIVQRYGIPIPKPHQVMPHAARSGTSQATSDDNPAPHVDDYFDGELDESVPYEPKKRRILRKEDHESFTKPADNAISMLSTKQRKHNSKSSSTSQDYGNLSVDMDEYLFSRPGDKNIQHSDDQIEHSTDAVSHRANKEWAANYRIPHLNEIRREVDKRTSMLNQGGKQSTIAQACTTCKMSSKSLIEAVHTCWANLHFCDPDFACWRRTLDEPMENVGWKRCYSSDGWMLHVHEDAYIDSWYKDQIGRTLGPNPENYDTLKREKYLQRWKDRQVREAGGEVRSQRRGPTVGMTRHEFEQTFEPQQDLWAKTQSYDYIRTNANKTGEADASMAWVKKRFDQEKAKQEKERLDRETAEFIKKLEEQRLQYRAEQAAQAEQMHKAITDTLGR